MINVIEMMQKKTYVQLCKTKSTAYNNEQTTTLVREKFTNPKNYGTYTKPRSVDNKTYVAPEAFATHFSRLYASQDTDIASSGVKLLESDRY